MTEPQDRTLGASAETAPPSDSRRKFPDQHSSRLALGLVLAYAVFQAALFYALDHRRMVNAARPSRAQDGFSKKSARDTPRDL